MLLNFLGKKLKIILFGNNFYVRFKNNNNYLLKYSLYTSALNYFILLLYCLHFRSGFLNRIRWQVSFNVCFERHC